MPGFDYDMIVIGSGPGGQRAAIQSAKLKKKTALIDSNPHIGGVCLHDGTIPSKSFREAILQLSGFRLRSHYGESFRVKHNIEMSDLTHWSVDIVNNIEQTLRSHLLRNKVETICGVASFEDAHHVKVTQGNKQEVLSAEYVVIATGTAARRPPGFEFYNEVILDSNGILSQIQAGSLDIGITGIPITDDCFHCEPIYRDEMVLAVPVNAHYEKLCRQKASMERLLQEPYLLREDGSGTKKEAEQFLETLGLDGNSLNIVARINNLEAIKQSIIYGLGVSILSKKVTADLERDNRVIVFPLSNGGAYRSYYLIYRKSKIQNHQLWKFIEFVEHFYTQK